MAANLGFESLTFLVFQIITFHQLQLSIEREGLLRYRQDGSWQRRTTGNPLVLVSFLVRCTRQSWRSSLGIAEYLWGLPSSLAWTPTGENSHVWVPYSSHCGQQIFSASEPSPSESTGFYLSRSSWALVLPRSCTRTYFFYEQPPAKYIQSSSIFYRWCHSLLFVVLPHRPPCKHWQRSWLPRRHETKVTKTIPISTALAKKSDHKKKVKKQRKMKWKNGQIKPKETQVWFWREIREGI